MMLFPPSISCATSLLSSCPVDWLNIQTCVQRLFLKVETSLKLITYWRGDLRRDGHLFRGHVTHNSDLPILRRDEAEEEDWNEVDLGAEEVVARHLAKRSPKFVGEKKIKKLLKKKAVFKLPKALIGGIGLSGGGLGGLGIGALGPQLIGALPLRSINGLPLIGKRKKRSPKVQQVGQKVIKKMLKKKVLFKLPKKMIGGIGLSGGGLGGLGLGAFGPQLVRALPLPINGLPLIGKRKKRSPNPKIVGYDAKFKKKLVTKKALFKLPKAMIGGIGLSGGGLGGFGLGAFGTQLIGALPLRSINGLPLIG